MVMLFRTTILVCILISGNLAASSIYHDQDLKCSNNQYLSSLSKKTVNKGKKSFIRKCLSHSSSISKDIRCTTGTPFKCGGKFESCSDPNSWISGFQVFDISPTAEIYVPYCCQSQSIKVGQCRQTRINRRSNNNNLSFVSSKGKVIRGLQCKYSKSGSQITGTILGFEECSLTSVGNAKTVGKTSSQSIKSTSGSSGNGASKSSKTYSNPENCFRRFIVKHVDYAEDKTDVIERSSVSEAKDCADRCLRSESSRCLSYKVQQSSPNGFYCELRSHYIDGSRQQWLASSTYTVYGNLTSCI